MDTLFQPSKLKVERADKHISELNSFVNSFLQTYPHRVFIEKDPNGTNRIKFKATKKLPLDVSLIIGDCIHNLRSALDLMTCEIVRLSGDTPDQWTQFAIRETRHELIAVMNGGKIKSARAEIFDLILNTIKPYKGGNDPLWGLHKLDIMDKHSLLIPYINVMSLTGVNGENDSGGTFSNLSFFIDQSKEFTAIQGAGNYKITNYGKASLNIFFTGVQVFERQPVIPTLHQLSQLLSGIIQTIEGGFGS